MNRDEVMALPDEELRIKAAELSGEWKDIAIHDELGPHGTLRGLGEVRELPDYLNDIAAAWRLFAGFDGEIEVGHDKNGWYCMIEVIPGDIGSAVLGDGDTAPQAITRAFILAKEAEINA